MPAGEPGKAPCAIAILDDNAVDRDYLRMLATAWAQRNGLCARIEAFPSAEAFLFWYGERKGVDILLLDIEMGRMNGVALARRLRQDRADIQMIFVTGYSDYIAEGYDVEALHYLMKPVNEEKLFEVLGKAAKRLRETEKCLFIDMNGEHVRIPLGDILYIEAQGHYVVVKTVSGVYKTKAALSDMEKNLSDGFYRCQRSFVIGLRHVKKTSRKDVTLTDDTVVPISRGMYEQVNTAMLAHFR